MKNVINSLIIILIALACMFAGCKSKSGQKLKEAEVLVLSDTMEAPMLENSYIFTDVQSVVNHMAITEPQSFKQYSYFSDYNNEKDYISYASVLIADETVYNIYKTGKDMHGHQSIHTPNNTLMVYYAAALKTLGIKYSISKDASDWSISWKDKIFYPGSN